MSSEEIAAWQFLPLGYALTVALELPVLWLLLAREHTWRTRLLAGFWLTACTYPIVVLVLPPLVEPRWGYSVYIAIAETFAPLAECVLFALFFWRRENEPPLPMTSRLRDMAAIVVANLVSWQVGGRLLE